MLSMLTYLKGIFVKMNFISDRTNKFSASLKFALKGVYCTSVLCPNNNPTVAFIDAAFRGLMNAKRLEHLFGAESSLVFHHSSA